MYNTNSFLNMISANFILFLFIISLFYSPFFWPRCLVQAQLSGVDNSNSNSNSKEPIYIGVLALGAILFLTVLFYILRIFGFFSCSGRTGSNSAPMARSGLNPELLNEFPVYTYPSVVDHIGPKMVPLECAVCLSPYEEEQSLRLIPRCDHLFHLHCVDQWLGAHTTCPVCRADLMAALSPSSFGHSHSSRVESMCIEELENGLGVGLIPKIQRDAMFENRQGILGWQVGEIWRSNSTGHVVDNHRAEEDAERFRLTN